MTDEKSNTPPKNASFDNEKVYRSYPVASTPSKENTMELVDKKHEYTLEKGGAGFSPMAEAQVEKLTPSKEELANSKDEKKNQQSSKQIEKITDKTKEAQSNKKDLQDEPYAVYHKAENGKTIREDGTRVKGWSEKVYTTAQYEDHIQKGDIDPRESLEFDETGGHVHRVKGVLEKKPPEKEKELEP
jgi:hypothetical protein